MKLGIRELVREVAARQQCYQKDAREVIDHLVAVIAEALEQGRGVHITHLGTFRPVPRRSRGPRVQFRPAAALRRRLTDRAKGA